jgi:hypothetical protein
VEKKGKKIYADIEMEEDYHPSANHQLRLNS